MTTVEKLFVWIFERKRRIIEQVKQQTDLYSQHLASKLLLGEITPPQWLWNPNLNSDSSSLEELKEEMISELLLPHPRPAVPYSAGHCSVYNKPVVRNNGELSEGLSMETQVSKKGFNTGDKPGTLLDICDNDIAHALSNVPDPDLNATSTRGQSEAGILKTYPDNVFNARDIPTTMIDFSDNDIGCSLNCAPEFDFSVTPSERETGARISNVHIDNGLVIGDKPTTLLNCYDNDTDHAFNFVLASGPNAGSPQRQTEVRLGNNCPDIVFNARDRPTTMIDFSDNDIGCSLNCVPEFDFSATPSERETGARISIVHNYNGLVIGDKPTTLLNCYEAFNFVPASGPSAGSPQWQTEVRIGNTCPDNVFNARDRPITMIDFSDDIGCSLNCGSEFVFSVTPSERETGARISNVHNDNGLIIGDKPTTLLNCYDNDTDHTFNFVPASGPNAGSPQRQTEVRIENTCTAPDQSLARMQMSKSRHMTLETRNSAKTAAQSRYANANHFSVCYSGNKMSRMVSQRIDHDNELFGLATYSDSSGANSVVKQAVAECPGKENNANTDDGRITRSRSSYNLSSQESRSLNVEKSSDIVKSGASKSRSLNLEKSSDIVKSGASKRPLLVNSPNQFQGINLHNVPGCEVVSRCPDSNVLVHNNKDGNTENTVETEVISGGLIESRTACSASNLDAACRSVGLETSISRPPVFGMFVKPKTLDFDDMEKCLKKISGPVLEKGGLENSAPQISPVKSAASLDKITFLCTSRKSSENQSLEPNVSNKNTDSWRGPSQICVDECVEHNADASKLKMNNNVMYVADKSKYVQDIQHSPVFHVSDTVLSSAGLDELCWLQVQDCELGYDERGIEEGTPFSLKHQELRPSFVSSLTNHSTLDQGCRAGEAGVTDPSSSGHDISHCCEEDIHDLTCHEINSDKGKMIGLACRERTLLEKNLHVGEDGLLASGSTRSVHLKENNTSPSKIVEHSLLQKSSFPRRRLRPAAENSWPQFARRQIECQQASFFSASPGCRVKEIHCAGVGYNLGTDKQSQYEEDVAQSSRDKSPDIEKHWKVKDHSTQGAGPSAEIQLDQDELGFEKRNHGSNIPSTFKNGVLGTSILSVFTSDTDERFQDCSFENVKTVNTSHTDGDVRIQGDESHYKDKLHAGNDVALKNKGDLTHPERTLQETEHFEEVVSFSHSILSPQDKHLDFFAADQAKPEFEGFLIVTEEDGQSTIVRDAFSLENFDLPSAAMEHASILEQLCKSASVHTPLLKFSTTFKLNRTPDVYQSVPNGLLEHMDLTGTLNVNNGDKQLRASYSYVDEVNHAFQGSSFSNPHFSWSLKEHPMSPIGKFWGRFPVNSSSSEKERSSNPELTCFPIEEDPSISEENGNGDEEADVIQEDNFATRMNCGGKRERLPGITEAHDPLTSVSAAERFSDRSSLDFLNTEVSFTGAHSEVKQKLGDQNNKRRCTNEAKENHVKKASKWLNNRFSKPKLLGKTCLKKGVQSLSEREPKHHNIVTNIPSFAPFVQQKQVAAVATGKRDIKVKALETAKRLEVKKENEQKMEEALKMKMKEKEQKKKDADMAARKRQREEKETKNKEKKKTN